MSGERESFDPVTSQQRRVLWIVLALNVLLVAILAGAGVWADSTGLIANALDNGSDAVVYALSLYAVGRSLQWKRFAAAASGVLLLVFALGVLGDTARRFFSGSEPVGSIMMAMALIAAGINLVCVWLLGRLKHDDVNLRAAETFSANDFIANGGVLIAGALVAWTGQRWPDLLVGLAVAAVAAKGGIDILLDARRTRSGADDDRPRGDES